jgi:hypothetical protein
MLNKKPDPPRRIFSSRKTRRRPLRLGGFARPILFFFFLLAKAQRRIRRGGLCGLAALRANKFLFF